MRGLKAFDLFWNLLGFYVLWLIKIAPKKGKVSYKYIKLDLAGCSI